MVSLQGNIGCVGICPQARAAVQSDVMGGVFNVAGAIQNAAGKLQAGDIILIELHAPVGPDTRYVAMQHCPDGYLRGHPTIRRQGDCRHRGRRQLASDEPPGICRSCSLYTGTF